MSSNTTRRSILSFTTGYNNILTSYDGINYSSTIITIGENVFDLNNIKDISYYGSTLVIVATDSSDPNITTYYSISTTNGRTWSAHPTISGITYSTLNLVINDSLWIVSEIDTSNEVYVNYINRSTDGGLTWTRTQDPSFTLNVGKIRANSSLFVAFDMSDVESDSPNFNSKVFLQTSSNGIDWVTPSINNTIRDLYAVPRFRRVRIVDIRYNGTMWLGIVYLEVRDPGGENAGNTNYTISSTDGITWELSSSINTSGLGYTICIGFNSNMWVVGGQSILNDPGDVIGTNMMAYSTNGSNWTASSSMLSLNQYGFIYSIAWSGSNWVASGHSSNYIATYYYSTDAATWYESPINQSNIDTGYSAYSELLIATSFTGPLYTYETALSNAVPTDPLEKEDYFSVIMNNFSNNSSTTAVTVNSTYLVTYYRSIGANIPVNSSINFLPAVNRVVGESVITSLSNLDYVLFPENYIIFISSNTYVTSNVNLVVTSGGQRTPLASNATFVVYGKLIKFLTSSLPSPALAQVLSTYYTYTSALATQVPSDSIDKAAYFAALMNNFSNYSSSTAVTVSSNNSSNLVNYYINQGASIPVGTPLRFLPTNSSRVVSQAVITSLSNGDYVIFPDNYSVIIAGKTYAISSNSITITASGQTSNVAPGGEFTVYNKTLEFITASSPGVTVVTASTSNPSPPCFLEGTKILCLVDEKEQYITIESLAKGTLVKTLLDGYKPVTHIGYSKMTNSGLSTRERSQLYVCTPEKYPTLIEPLYITGCHSILVDELSEKQREETMKVYNKVFATDKKYRLEAYLDERADPWPEKGECTVWHVSLEHENEVCNYGIYANGLLVESISNRAITTSKTLTLV